jgi:hypothetical protein
VIMIDNAQAIPTRVLAEIRNATRTPAATVPRPIFAECLRKSRRDLVSSSLPMLIISFRDPASNASHQAGFFIEVMKAAQEVPSA